MVILSVELSELSADRKRTRIRYIFFTNRRRKKWK